MVQLEAVFLQPFGQFFRAQTLVPLGGGSVHQQAVARGGTQGIDHEDLPIRVALLEDHGCILRGVDGTGDAGGKGHVNDVLALLQEGREEVHILADAHLRGAGIGALGHAVVKLIKGDRLPQVVGILHTVQAVVEADIGDADRVKMLLGQISRGAASQNIGHGESLLFVF